MFKQVHGCFGFRLLFLFQERVGFHALLIHGDDFESPSSADGHQIGREVFVGRVRYLVTQNIGFEEIEETVFGFQFDLSRRQAFLCFHIAVYLVVQATFELSTLSG